MTYRRHIGSVGKLVSPTTSLPREPSRARGDRFHLTLVSCDLETCQYWPHANTKGNQAGAGAGTTPGRTAQPANNSQSLFPQLPLPYPSLLFPSLPQGQSASLLLTLNTWISRYKDQKGTQDHLSLSPFLQETDALERRGSAVLTQLLPERRFKAEQG